MWKNRHNSWLMAFLSFFFRVKSNRANFPIFLFPPLLSPSFFHFGHCSIGFLFNGGETECIILLLTDRLSENMAKPSTEAAAISKNKATFLSIFSSFPENKICFLFLFYCYRF